MAPAYRQVQPLAGFMTEAHPFNSFAARRWDGMRRRPNQFWWFLANPAAGSSPHPELYRFM
jgi:hypothetical protein